MSDNLMRDECRAAYDEWCREMRVCDTTFAPWSMPDSKPSYAWEAWQAAWNYRNKHSVHIQSRLHDKDIKGEISEGGKWPQLSLSTKTSADEAVQPRICFGCGQRHKSGIPCVTSTER